MSVHNRSSHGPKGGPKLSTTTTETVSITSLGWDEYLVRKGDQTRIIKTKHQNTDEDKALLHEYHELNRAKTKERALRVVGAPLVPIKVIFRGFGRVIGALVRESKNGYREAITVEVPTK